MKHVITAATFAILMAGQAQALSCIRPDVARAFNWASDAEESYAVIWGSVRYAPPPAQTENFSNQPVGYEVSAMFSGHALGVDGFVPIEPLEVTIKVGCSGPWCGSPPPMSTSLLAFVEATSSGYVLHADACGGQVFAPVAVADLDRVENCMRGLACEENLTR